jgi:hypothetical protein
VATCRSDRAELTTLGELSPSADMRAGSAFDDIDGTEGGRLKPHKVAFPAA